MECKFLSNGLRIGYDQIVKPCCVFQPNSDWNEHNHISQVDFTTWHQSEKIVKFQKELTQGWPAECSECAQVESTGRGDSVRLGSNSAYGSFAPDDIVVEIRPGNVCNFACQTCWPEASSRVLEYYNQANLLKNKTVVNESIKNFEFLLPIKDRIKEIVVLGGEPFYDKNCLRLFDWLVENNFKSKLSIYTNGSNVNFDFLNNYQSNLHLTFSLDAVGAPAEYIRFGTEWTKVLDNFNKVKTYDNVSLRVNITTSPYNYFYLRELIDLLIEDWPDMVFFGTAATSPNVTFMDESVIPLSHRKQLTDSLGQSIIALLKSKISQEQKDNAVNMIRSIINNLKTMSWDQNKFNQFVEFVKTMDNVKRIDINNYCPDVAVMLDCK